MISSVPRQPVLVCKCRHAMLVHLVRCCVRGCPCKAFTLRLPQ